MIFRRELRMDFLAPRTALAGALCAVVWFAASMAVTSAADVDFERDVAPLLVDRCLECHQPNKRSGELDLSDRQGLVRGGSQGAALAPGKPDESLLWKRVIAGEMPPRDGHGARAAAPLSTTEQAALKAWIAAGAPWPDERRLGLHEKRLDLHAARRHWAFQPVVRPPVPKLEQGCRVANPIDAFITEPLRRAGLVQSPPAARSVWLRRLSLDLRGFPPSLEEQDEVAADDRPDLEARWVDRFLADPAYGERWARHWLDLVRYADSNGYERDGPKPGVWKYRDYVIDAFNADLPYDRFVLEQIAGDELDGASVTTRLATGFHALGPWNDEVDPLEAAQYRADELDDMIRTTSQAFLGLSLGCARCHQHKFDPLTMVDYYSLAAILDPLKRPNEGRTDRDFPLGTFEQRQAEARRNGTIAELDRRIAQIQKDQPADAAAQVVALRDEQRRLRENLPDLPRGYVLYEDTAETPPTHLLLFGRASNPGPRMTPRVPEILAPTQPEFPSPGDHSTRRRLAFARWLVDPRNPLTARVVVNRVWQHHFGTGIVATSSDFGTQGARPTHPELLDWLAHWFMHDAGWSFKRLHRLILLSETWRQASVPATGGAGRPDEARPHPDPNNHLLARFPTRRLEAEAIRDSVLAVAGTMRRTLGGPAVALPIPAEVIEAHTDKQAAWQPAGEPEINRRSVYAYTKRTLLVPLFETLDVCDTTQSAERRAVTTVAPQALTLFNGEFVNRQAERFADRLLREAPATADGRVVRAWRLALGREPTADERTAAVRFLQTEAAGDATSDNPAKDDRSAGATASRQNDAGRHDADRRALTQLCRVLFNLNEFAYP